MSPQRTPVIRTEYQRVRMVVNRTSQVLRGMLVGSYAVSGTRCCHVRLEVNSIVFHMEVLGRVSVGRATSAFEDAECGFFVEVVDEADAVFVSIAHVLALVDVVVIEGGA